MVIETDMQFIFVALKNLKILVQIILTFYNE